MKHAVLSVLLGVALIACGGATSQQTDGTGGTTGGETNPQAFIVTGTVRNNGGQPVAGADVWASSTPNDNMNALATTDQQGRFRLQLSPTPSTWTVGEHTS